MLYILLVLEGIFIIALYALFGRISDEEMSPVYLSMIFIAFLFAGYYYQLYKKTLLGKVLLIIDGVIVFTISLFLSNSYETLSESLVTYGELITIGISLFIFSVCLLISRGKFSKILFIFTTIFMSVMLYYVFFSILDF